MSTTILFTCQHCHLEAETHMDEPKLVHGNCYLVKCNECGKDSAMYISMYPLNQTVASELMKPSKQRK